MISQRQPGHEAGAISPGISVDCHKLIADVISFVGLGRKFQIWEPGRFRAHLAEATGTVRALKKQPGSRVAAHDAQKVRE